MGQGRSDGGALSAVSRMVEDRDSALRLKLLQDLSCPVGGAVVYDDDLLVEGYGLDAAKDLFNERPLVVYGDDNGELHRFESLHRGRFW